jgi:hypothetical protein
MGYNHYVHRNDNGYNRKIISPVSIQVVCLSIVLMYTDILIYYYFFLLVGRSKYRFEQL